MKKKIIYLLLLVCCSCYAQKEKDSTITGATTQKVIYLYPTTKQLDKIRKTFDSEEDFYIVADDANFYLHLAHEYMYKNKIDYDTIPINIPIYLAEEKKRLFIPQNMGFGGFFIYEKGKYEDFVSSIDIGLKWEFINGHWYKKNN